MAYINESDLQKIGFKKLGHEVKISDKAAIYNPELIELGDFCRIDDFCIISGRVTVGSYCHITPMCLVAGGEPGIIIRDFCTLAYGVKIFAQSDDYSGEFMVNSLIPKEFKNEKLETVELERHCILGTNSVVLPGVKLAEGTSSGAMTLFNKSTLSWGVYVGTPARRMKNRSKTILKKEREFIGNKNDPI